ncbi:MAG: TolA-binding protein [Gammaproteobacteria bacterium]|jgi:TolA-binding protein
MIARLLIVLLAIFLYACAERGIDIGRTIADLSNQSEIIETIELEPSVTFDIDRKKVIESFRTLVELTADGGGNGDELRRLAELELESSLDNRLSDDSDLQQTGLSESRQAIEYYEQYLQRYPDRADNDRSLYQLSRAYALESESEKSLEVLNRIVLQYPDSSFIDEVQFRRGEILFVERDYESAEQAYGSIVSLYPESLFYEKAIYKYGWTQFKQSRYEEALNSYILMLDLNLSANNIGEIDYDAKLSRADRELLEDVARVASLSFSYTEDILYISDYFNRNGKRDYEPLLYKDLGNLFLSKNRFVDSADLYLAYTQEYPYSAHAPYFHQRAIDINRNAGYSDILLTEKIAYVDRYDVGTEFWLLQKSTTRENIKPVLAEHLDDLATHFHALASSSKKPADYRQSASWYRRFLKSFPDHPKSSRMNFLLAENLFDAQQFELAITEYEKTAYQFPPHQDNAEAAYASLIAYDRLITASPDEQRRQLGQKRIDSAVRFTTSFPNDQRILAVELQSAGQYFEWKDYTKAANAATRLTSNKTTSAKSRVAAWTILADSQFLSSTFRESELSYTNLVNFLPRNDKAIKPVREQIAASIYKQGELARNDGNQEVAAMHFVRLGQVIPESEKRIIADYDAATAYIQLKDWPRAIKQLENFRQRYPKVVKWEQEVSEKLALAYSENGDLSLAAGEMLLLAKSSKTPERKRDLMWRSAELFEQAGKKSQAVAVYKTYVDSYPYPLDRSIELRFKISEYYRARSDQKNLDRWLNEIIKADARAKSKATPRSKFLAAKSTIELVQPLHQSYQKAKLTVPLKTSLARKKKLMQSSIQGYSKALKYQVAEVTTEATFQIAEIYHDFARSLLDSQRPKGLSEEELEEYDLLLEEQAFPFEEKAIDIHLTNFKRIPSGVFDEATQKSLQILGQLMPFRFARRESSDSYVEFE